MPRTALTPITQPGDRVTAPTALTWTAADVANKNSFPLVGNELVLIWNSGASAHTVTLTSLADRYGRSGDITAFSVAAGTYYVFGPVAYDVNEGWRQADNSFYLEANHAEIKFCILKPPA